MKSEFNLCFTREEITHATYWVKITPEDAATIRVMTEEQIASWVSEQEFDWNHGKEFCEGEGERGMFDFELEEHEVHEKLIPQSAVRIERTTNHLETFVLGKAHNITLSNEGGNEAESFLTPVCTCGWKGKPVSCMHNFQMHEVAEQQRKHLENPDAS